MPGKQDPPTVLPEAGALAASAEPLAVFSRARVPAEYGNLQVTVFQDEQAARRQALSLEHMALVIGDVREGEEVPVRIHSECWSGEALHSLGVRSVSLFTNNPLKLSDQALLHRARPTAPPRPVDSVGFTLETDDLVFGHGMDDKQRFRELPFIATPG